jgi:hypothetical protein
MWFVTQCTPPNTAPQRGIYDVHPTGRTLRSARFQAIFVAWNWVRKRGVVSSHPQYPAGA